MATPHEGPARGPWEAAAETQSEARQGPERCFPERRRRPVACTQPRLLSCLCKRAAPPVVSCCFCERAAPAEPVTKALLSCRGRLTVESWTPACKGTVVSLGKSWWCFVTRSLEVRGSAISLHFPLLLMTRVPKEASTRIASYRGRCPVESRLFAQRQEARDRCVPRSRTEGPR